MAEYGREGGPRWAHLIWIEVESSHSLLVELVVWQYPIHCLCEDLCVCIREKRGEKWVAGEEAKEQAQLLLQCLKSSA